MREITSVKEAHQFALKAKSHGRRVGFVPTMGALHEGHLSLIAEARKQCEIVMVSIFVNPIQFGPNEGFNNYPRDQKKDKKLLKDIGIDALFIPKAGEIFPDGFRTYVEVEGLSARLCGRSRPGHFRGVATIIVKLFNIIMPDAAFFGEKDYQQLQIIKRLARDLNYPIEICPVPTVREFDGLALSSRNRHLNTQEKRAATILYKALSLAKAEIEAGEKDLRKVITRMRSLIGSEPAVRIDYIELVDPLTLEERRGVQGKMVALIAAHLGRTRLIDNLMIQA